jgi:hypothetical protein
MINRQRNKCPSDITYLILCVVRTALLATSILAVLCAVCCYVVCPALCTVYCALYTVLNGMLTCAWVLCGVLQYFYFCVLLCYALLRSVLLFCVHSVLQCLNYHL